MRHIFLMLLLGSTFALGAEQRDVNEVEMVDADDPLMNQAIEHARATLDEFLSLAAHPPAGASNFKLKVIVRDKSRTEHFWVTPFRISSNAFSGTLANDPKVVTNVKGGQRIRFTREDVSDWGYEKDGHQIGSFTVCVLFKKMPLDEAAYYRKNYGFDC